MSGSSGLILNRALNAYVEYQANLSKGMVYAEPLNELNEIIAGLIQKVNDQQEHIEKLEKLIITNLIKVQEEK